MSRVELVGVLNLTPDSFSDGGEYYDPEKAYDHALEMNYQGASYIDVGGESTRPGATPIHPDIEWRRIEPVLRRLIPLYSNNLSVDTYHPEIVYQAAQLGSFTINDVTGFNNPQMIEAAADLQLTCIVSHLPESYGQDIQSAHKDKPVDSVAQVQDELLAKRAKMTNAGIKKDQIILDPGIGFGKVAELNWELLEFAAKVPDTEVMIGYSRKRFLGEKRTTIERNLEAGRIAIAAGAAFLRVHDVAGHRELLQ